jgi:uncharacterized protein with gpF-like domain
MKSSTMWAILTKAAGNVSVFNLRQWEKATERILGFPWRSPEHWWKDAEAAWAQENWRLLKRYEEDYIAGVTEAVSRGVRQGAGLQDVMAELSKLRTHVANNLDLLARDQVGKLQAQVTKNRMQNVGMDEYLWWTQRDERVRGTPGGLYPKARPSHYIMHGMICRWSDSTVYADPGSDVDESGRIHWRPRTGDMPDGIAGEPIACRCTATAFWDGYLRSLEAPGST